MLAPPREPVISPGGRHSGISFAAALMRRCSRRSSSASSACSRSTSVSAWPCQRRKNWFGERRKVSEGALFDEGNALRSIRARPNLSEGSVSEKRTTLRSVRTRPKAIQLCIHDQKRQYAVRGLSSQPIDQYDGAKARTASES